jgi:hypothetical protein
VFVTVPFKNLHNDDFKLAKLLPFIKNTKVEFTRPIFNAILAFYELTLVSNSELTERNGCHGQGKLIV